MVVIVKVLVPVFFTFIVVNFVVSILGWSFSALRSAAKGAPGVQEDLARLYRLWWQVSYLRKYRC